MTLSKLTPMVTRRSFIRGLGLMSAAAALSACSQVRNTAPQTPLLAIIHTNDIHGHAVAVEGTDDARGNFSMAAVAALKTEWEEKGYDVLLVDAGDVVQGMPLVDAAKGSSAIAFMNACGYDLMAVGNHEFDWGAEELANNEQNANFPFLSANILVKETGEPRFPTSKVFELSSGTRIGFFGLTTPSTASVSNPKNVGDLRFLSDDELYSCAQAQVDELRGQGCDIVACLGHIGNSEMSGCTSEDVIAHVKGIDLFIDGHDHDEVQKEVSGTLLVETGCYLHNIGVVVIDEGAPSPELVAAGSYDGIDGSVQAIIDSENARISRELDVVLGETPFLLDGRDVPGVRTQETNLGDFCADAFLWTASKECDKEIDAGITNGGSMRVSIEPGDISLRVIKSVMPFSGELVVVNVTGAQLLEALEAACQAAGTDDPIGAFPQVSGITFTLDVSVPYEEGPDYPNSTFASPAAPGARITITDVGGRVFDVDETYSVATTTFICAGGDTYHAFKDAADAEQPINIGFDYEAMTSYLVEGCDHKVPDTYANPQGRINIVGTE
ncbi:MAG: bifunctional metallophosphatase/5'-nucleotidase [Atopobiaceae bacterium]|nr:bifunctional metallophosphatase/5'-nucleotidase [Atopobiaceae bacterium]